MKNIEGLYTDCYERDQPEGTYRFAKNVTLNTAGAIENELGFTNLGDIVPGSPIGVVTMGADATVFSTDGTTGYIGKLTTSGLVSTYTLVYSSTALGFTLNSPIKGEYQLRPNGERVVAWIELVNPNPPRLINIDNPEITSINDLKIFPEFAIPQVSFIVPDTGGSLLTGMYIPIFKYQADDLTETNWFVAPSPIPIIDDAFTEPFDKIDGAAAGTPTSKVINLTLTQLDTSYSKIVIGVIYSKQGVLTASRLREITINSTVTLSITGAEAGTDVSLDEVLTPLANYKSAKAITQLNNQLLLANLTNSDVIDFQPIANNVIVNWTSTLVECTQPASKAPTLTKGFQSGEVYAFYIVLELNGGQLLAYHIPGRGSTTGELNTDNTAINGLSGKHFQVADTSNTGGGVSNMAYWENSTESYPSTFPVGLAFNGATQVLAGQHVRHHKFPDLTTVIDSRWTGVGTNRLPRLGINVSNVNITVDIQAKIKGWRIAWAKRDYANSLVLGADTLHLTADSTEATGLQWSTGGNWNIKAFTGSGESNTGDWRDMLVWQQPSGGSPSSTIYKAIRGHCADLLYDRPGVIPDYVHFLYKIQARNLEINYSQFGGGGGKLMRSGKDASQAPGVVVDWTTAEALKFPTFGSNNKTKLDNFQYVGQNTGSGTISTKRTEPIIYSELKDLKTILEAHGTTNSIISYTGATPINTNGFPIWHTHSSSHNADSNFTAAFDDFENTYVMYYKKILSDVYVSYTNQSLVFTDSRQSDLTQTTLLSIFGGDTTVGLMSYMTTSVQSPTVADPSSDSNVNLHGPRTFKYFCAESRHTWGYRYEASNNITDKYAPHTNPRDFWFPSANALAGDSLIDTNVFQLNKLSYNPDYDVVNEFVPAVIMGRLSDFVVDAPTTIIYSTTQNLESKDISWRTFPANNRWVQPRNRGPIVNLQGSQNKDLIIHHRDSFFITQSNAVLNTDSTDVNLVSADLFGIAPRELVTAENGFAGTQNSLACKTTKVGYAFIDDSQGKAFLFDGSLQEISNAGMRKFFRDEASGVAEDNAYNGSGYNIAYDEISNRLILSKKKTSKSFTISYSPRQKTWTSFHGYIPDYMFSLTGNKLLSFSNSILYLHNTGPRGVYYSGSPVSSFIDVISTKDPDKSQIFQLFEWITAIYNGGIQQYDKTIDYLTVRAEDQCTGRVPIVRISNINQLYSQNVKNLGETWSFNGLSDISLAPNFLTDFYNDFNLDTTKLNSNLPWFQKRKFISKYLVCRLEYANLDNSQFLLFSTGATCRPSPY